MARNCPSKGQGQKPPFKYKKKPSARITETADEKEEDSSDEEDNRSQTSGSTKVEPSLMAQINKLKTEDKEAIFAKLINEGF